MNDTVDSEKMGKIKFLENTVQELLQDKDDDTREIASLRKQLGKAEMKLTTEKEKSDRMTRNMKR